jgi:hypothetical protein
MDYITHKSQLVPLVEAVYREIFPSRKLRFNFKVISDDGMIRLAGAPIPGITLGNIFYRISYLKENPELLALVAAGHELGHWKSPHYQAKTLEETKSFLFQFRWEDEIVDNNIGGYKAAVTEIQLTREADGKTGFDPHISHDSGYTIASKIHKSTSGNLEQGYDILEKIYNDNNFFERFVESH